MIMFIMNDRTTTDDKNYFQSNSPNEWGPIKKEYFDDIYELPSVQNFSKMKGFESFVKSENLLMATFDEGEKWWVLGRIAYPERVGLPEWVKGLTGR
jgi:hypothetical protein